MTEWSPGYSWTQLGPTVPPSPGPREGGGHPDRLTFGDTIEHPGITVQTRCAWNKNRKKPAATIRSSTRQNEDGNDMNVTVKNDKFQGKNAKINMRSSQLRSTAEFKNVKESKAPDKVQKNHVLAFQ